MERRTGQQISAQRSWRIESSLRPLMRERELPDLETLAAQLKRGNQDLAISVIEALLNNETSFFRDAALFDLLDRRVLPAIASANAATRRLRIWSAGCSTGQEAYSLAMMIRAGGTRWAGWSIDILGTDVSPATVARARRGQYSQFEIQRGLPVRTMLRWFRQDGEDWIVDPVIKRMVRFGTHNLMEVPPGRFDIILCRNVLMYFQPQVRARVFERLATALEPAGVLMLGAGETVIGQTNRFASHPDWRGLYAATTATDSLRRAG